MFGEVKSEAFASARSTKASAGLAVCPSVFSGGFWPVGALDGRVYGAMNGRDAAAKQIQKRGLSGLHLISRMLKVRLKQICCE